MRPGSLWEAAMALLNFKKREKFAAPVNGQLEAFLQGYSIEVMPISRAPRSTRWSPPPSVWPPTAIR
jgi:hypothetical protein